MPPIGCIASPVNLRAKYAAPTENQACFRGLIIMLNNVGKEVCSFVTSARNDTPKYVRTKGKTIYVTPQYFAGICDGHDYARPLSSSRTGYNDSLTARLCIWIPRKLGQALRGSRTIPAMSDAELKRRDNFLTIAACVIQEAQKRTLKKSSWALGRETSTANQLDKKFFERYQSHFSDNVEALRSKYLQGKRNWSMYAVFSEAHRLAFGHAVKQTSPSSHASMMLGLADRIDRKITAHFEVSPRRPVIDPIAAERSLRRSGKFLGA
jgi:hypothetical protein